VARSGKVSLCILDERWPFAYLQVYCDARLETDPALVVDVMMAVGGRMSGQPLPEQARPVVQAMAEREGRVVLRCRPHETFAQPPRHLHGNDQQEEVGHALDHGGGRVECEGPAVRARPLDAVRAVKGRDFLRSKRTLTLAHLPSGSSFFLSGRRGSIPRRPDVLHPALRLAAAARSSSRSR
jgi:hypothetical protein